MSISEEDLRKAALKLPPKARAALAEDLFDSLADEADEEEDVEAAWAAEIERRVEEVESGNAKTVPWSEAQKQIAETLKKARGR
jgi:putative addiction module component (TIGR02574 family)